jgi:hypothetical protein
MLSIASSPAETKLVTVDLMKQVLGMTNNDQDALLLRYINAACLDMARYCGRDETFQFETGTATETWYLDASQDAPLWPSHWPVTAITSVTEDGTALTSSYYELDGKRRLWRMDGSGYRSCWSACKIVVVYTGGYTLSAGCPADLAQVCIELVTRAWSAKARDPLLKSESIPGVISSDYALPGTAGGIEGVMPSDLAGKLNNYRNFSFG